MKKALLFLLTGIMVVGTMTACGSKDNAGANTEVNTEVNTEAVVDTEVVVDTEEFVEDEVVEASELEGIVNSIYENHSPIELMLGTIPVNVADVDDLTYNTGLTSGEKLVEAVRSETMMGSQAYSLVVVKVADAADAQAVADEMYDNIDQRKWICVEAGDKMVATFGDIVMLMMVDVEYADAVTAQSIVDAFAAACGAELDYVR